MRWAIRVPQPGTAVLPNPTENLSTMEGEGIEIIFPNGVDLGTANIAGDLHVSSDGTLLSNSLNAAADGWDACGTITGNATKNRFLTAWRMYARLIRKHGN